MKTVQEPKKLHKANAIKLSQSKYFWLVENLATEL
jgi:hypothetical protein